MRRYRRPPARPAVCQRVGCGRQFQAVKPALYCSPSCRQLAYVARKSALDPAFRLALLAARADYQRRRRRNGNRPLRWPRAAPDGS